MDVLDLLSSFKLPFVFATNHGGTPESKKAATLSEQFNLNIHVDQMLLSHTPMKGLLPRYQNKLIMVIGQTKELTDAIMIAYVVCKSPLNVLWALLG